MGIIQIDHKEYQDMVRKLSDNTLRYIIQDAGEALKAMPDNPKAGYYQDEINYCAMELKRRKNKKS